MEVLVAYNGKQKKIQTAVNLKNCFDVKNNPKAADHMLPLLYNNGEVQEVVGTVDKRGTEDDPFFVILIAPMDGELYTSLWENIDNLKLSVKQIEGDGNGYLFVLS